MIFSTWRYVVLLWKKKLIIEERGVTIKSNVEDNRLGFKSSAPILKFVLQRKLDIELGNGG